MQATFGNQVLYTEKFSLCFFKETERRDRRPLLFFIVMSSGAARRSRNVKS